MKKECEIIQDLLFGYQDDVLTPSSREFVEDHLKTCNECQMLLKEIEQETKKKPKEKEVEYLKKIKRKLNKKSIMIFTSLILLILLIIFNVISYIKYQQIASQMEIYLEENITQEQLNLIVEKIKSEDETVEITYYSKQEELEKFKDQFKNKSDLLESYEKDRNPIPASYSVKINKQAIERLENVLRELQGVKYVKTYINASPYLWILGKEK